MCGIAGFALTKRSLNRFPVGDFAKALLVGNQSRGKQATGYVGVVPGKSKPRVACHKLPVEASEFVKLHTLDRRTQIALLHTRHHTKGDPKESDNNHPVRWESCFAVHNGSIQNDDDVLVEAGIDKEKRMGEVDSFAVPVALEYHGWGDESDIRTSLHMLKGSMAIAAIDPINKPGRVLLARGDSSPLAALLSPQGIFWSSEKKALEDAWGATLGTPPKSWARDASEFGWYQFKEGEYWVVDVSTGQLVIRPGKFDVNRGSYNAAHFASQGVNTHTFRPYTTDGVDWTCWPNEKDCVFHDDCPDCNDGDACECWSGNPKHPCLNKGLDFEDLTKEYPTFRTHTTKHNLTKENISRPLGVRVTQSSGTPTRTAPSSSTAGESAVLKSTSHLALVGGEGGTLDTADCFFCEKPFVKTTMAKLHTVIEGIDALYACQACNNATKSLAKPAGYDEKFQPQVKKLITEAQYAAGVIDQAVQETAWEYKMPTSLIRHVCIHNTRRYVGNDDTKFAELILSVRQAFLGNVKIIEELNELDRTHD